MSIDWSHLPRDVIPLVCFCSRAGKHDGWRRDPATGYWVHGKCKKPSPQLCIKECDWCNKVFVPKYYSKVQLDFLGIMCDQCEPPNEAKEHERLGILYTAEQCEDSVNQPSGLMDHMSEEAPL